MENYHTSAPLVNSYDKVIEMGSKYITNISSSYNNKGIALNQLGRYEEAIKAYDQGIKVDPYPGLYVNKGGSYRK